ANDASGRTEFALLQLTLKEQGESLDHLFLHSFPSLHLHLSTTVQGTPVGIAPSVFLE
ncbi:hypothetical protein Ancab_001370, partial [Ancistrocladus abbreviatus]